MFGYGSTSDAMESVSSIGMKIILFGVLSILAMLAAVMLTAQRFIRPLDKIELGVAPDVLRRKNFIRPKAMPYTTPTGKVYDSGEFAAHLARAQEIIDWKGFPRRAAQSK